MSERRIAALLACGLIFALLIAAMVGPFGLSLGETLAGLLGRGDERALIVLWNIRLPRVAAAALVGAALAAAGAAYQTCFRNPLVSPDVLGVSAGAGFGAVLGILWALPVVAIQALSFGMGLAAVAVVLTLSAVLRGEVLSTVLCGVAVSALAGAGIGLVKMLADPENQLPAITFWLLGSLSGVKRPDVAMLVLPILAGLLPLWALRWRIGLLSLGEDEARTLGVDAGRLRFVVIGSATLITAAAVSVSGIIGWVGLMVPHMARMLTGPRFDRLLPASILLGAGFMVLVDTAARSLAQMEVPLGIQTSVLGAPAFLWLLAKGRSSWQD